MMIVLMTGLVAASGMKTMTDDQYYNSLARQAAEAGAVFAQDCMEKNEYVATWTGQTLGMGDNCNGSSNSTWSKTLVNTSRFETTWTVPSIPNTPDQQQIVVTGKTNLKRSSNGSVWKTYEHTLHVSVSSQLSASRLSFGYNRTPGVFFGVVDAKGTVQMLGHNGDGQLGNGTLTNSVSPRPYALPAGKIAKSIHTNFTSVGYSVFVVTTDGELYASGRNDMGQLGLGTAGADVLTPQKVLLPTTERVKQVYNLWRTTFVITESYKLYSFGECRFGSLGTGTVDGYTVDATYPHNCLKNGATYAYRSTPVQVNSGSNVMPAPTTSIYSRPAEMAVDWYGAFVRMEDSGRMYGWGVNDYGEMGDYGATNHFAVPEKLWNFGDNTGTTNPAASIAYDGATSYVVTTDGKIYGAGFNNFGQLNATNRSINYTTFMELSPLATSNACKEADGTRSYTKVVADEFFATLMTSTGKVCAMGLNGAGSLGVGSNSDNLSTSMFGITHPASYLQNTVRYGSTTAPPPAADITNCSMGPNEAGVNDDYRHNNTFIVTRTGEVWGAGSNYYGQLGIGVTGGSRNGFVKMQKFGPLFGQTRAKQVQCGRGTVVIITESGRVYTVGDNTWGQLGNGTTTDSNVPIQAKYTNVVRPIYY